MFGLFLLEIELLEMFFMDVKQIIPLAVAVVTVVSSIAMERIERLCWQGTAGCIRRCAVIHLWCALYTQNYWHPIQLYNSLNPLKDINIYKPLKGDFKASSSDD